MTVPYFYIIEHIESGKRSEETKQLMKKNCGPWKRTEESIQKFKDNRKNKGCGERNAMTNPDNRKKVSLSKIGKRKFINAETNEVRMFTTGTEPAGFVLSCLMG